MRLAVCVLALAACGPKVEPRPVRYDEELASAERASPSAAPAPAPRVEAPAGKGVRTGTIERARLLTVLDGGPAAFLRELEVTARMEGDRFVGWQLVQLLDRQGPLGQVDVVPGDVLLAVNGLPVSRPDQLQAIWDSLRTANQLEADLWRGSAKVTLKFAIDPPVATK